VSHRQRANRGYLCALGCQEERLLADKRGRQQDPHSSRAEWVFTGRHEERAVSERIVWYAAAHVVADQNKIKTQINMVEIYIINLDKRKDRKALFLSETATQLQEETLVWIEAIDGSTVAEQELTGFKWSSKNIEKKKRAYGCYKSHCKAIQQAIQSNHFPALILEDDAVLQETINLTELFASAPENTTLLYFGALLCTHHSLGGRKWRPTQEDNRHEWVKLPDTISIFGTHAYGFKTKQAAEEVLEFLHGLPAMPDYTLTRYRKHNPEKVRIFLPLQFTQRPGFSDIENKHMNRA